MVSLSCRQLQYSLAGDPSEDNIYDMDWLAKELNLKSMQDWYKVKVSIPNSRGGRGLMNIYGNSLQKGNNFVCYNDLQSSALKAIYPEHSWDQRLFSKSRKGFWHNIENQRQQLDYVAKALGIQKFEDWYNVTLEQVIAKGGRSVLFCYGNSLKKGKRSDRLYWRSY
jgi:hypothetical protein